MTQNTFNIYLRIILFERTVIIERNRRWRRIQGFNLDSKKLFASCYEKNSLFIFPVNEEKSTKNCIISFFSFLLLFIKLTLTDIRRRILDCKYAKTM